MPAPTHKTDYASEALSLLTSRYSKARPFTPAELSPVAWYRSDFSLNASGGLVLSWTDRVSSDGSHTLSPTGAPSYAANDAAFGSLPTVETGISDVLSNASPGFVLSAQPSTITIFAVGEVVGDPAAAPIIQITALTSTDGGTTWAPASAPAPTAGAYAIKLAELAVFATGLSPDAVSQLKSYASSRYGIAA